MRPPLCEDCGREFDPQSEGALVRFPADEDARQWYKRAEEEPGFVGHPPDLAWYCGEHLELVRHREDVTVLE